MALERIRKINNIGTYEKAGNGQIALKPFTYIYASNTYGKTTFCDILRSLKENNISIINNRKTIGCRETDKCIVEFTIDSKNVTFNGDLWEIPDGLNVRENLQIFDINFVNENVFTNFNIEHKNKENFTSFVLGDRSVELIGLLSEMENLLANKEQDIKTKKPLLDKRLKEYSYEDIRKEKYLDSFKDAECRVISSKEEIKTLEKQKNDIDKIKAIKSFKLLQMNFDSIVNLVKKVEEELKKYHSFDLTSIKVEIDKIKEGNPKITENWLKTSASISVGESCCPLCGSNIVDNEKIKIISKYFSEEVISIINSLENLIKDTNKEVREQSFGSLVARLMSAAKDILPYCNISKEANIEFDEYIKRLSKDIELFNQKIDVVKEELLNALGEKLASITLTEFSLIETRKLVYEIIPRILLTQDEINAKINSYNDVFEKYQCDLSEDFLDKKIDELTKVMQFDERILLRGMYNSEIEELKQLEEHVKELKKKIKDTRAKIDEQQEEFLNKYFSTIQSIFSKLGSENYRIERETTPRGKKKVYGVKIYFKNKLVDEIRYCLSESDRRALALSVFLAKIKIDNNPKEIIILDDPITSFDENRMRLFISVLNSLKDNAFCQTIVLLHYENFFKVITQSTDDKTLLKITRKSGNHNFEEITEEDDIFKTDYEKILNKIIKFINAEISDIAENDVRIYLDNFLHYHFAYDISKDKSISGGRLHDFIVNLEKVGLIDRDKKEELLLKVKFLNNSSHSFDSYTEEEKRSFVKDVYDSIHKL